MIDFFHLKEEESDPEMREWLEDPKNLLLAELFKAEREARKGGKRKTMDTHGFEVNLMENLMKLRDALWDYSYQPSRGAVHVVKDPVVREIFAAPYVDRVVQHWIVSQLSVWWEPRFNAHSCSCREGKGTSYGIRQLDKNIRHVSNNYSRKCYIVKLDITGYFMHIRRDLLFKRVKWGLDKQFAGHLDDKRYKILLHAVRAVIFDDPVDGVKMQGIYEDWRRVPLDKSLFAAAPGCGLVIGNLTSQFFSNVYLDALDRYITITLGYKHYVRYVDDFVIVVLPSELAGLKRDIRQIGTFLNGLGLSLNLKKTKVFNCWQSVPFLGATLRGGAVMPGKRVVRNFYKAAYRTAVGLNDTDTLMTYLGMMKHLDAGKVCARVFESVGWEYNKN